MLRAIAVLLFLLTLPFGFAGLFILTLLTVRHVPLLGSGKARLLQYIPNNTHNNTLVTFMALSFAAVLFSGGLMSLTAYQTSQGIWSMIGACIVVGMTLMAMKPRLSRLSRQKGH